LSLRLHHVNTTIIMNNETKITAIVCVLPVLADLIEDLIEANIYRNNVKLANKNLVAQIRRLDKLIMDSAPNEDNEQQVDAQLSFRKWIKENF